MNAPRRDLLLVPAELLQHLVEYAERFDVAESIGGAVLINEAQAILNYHAPKLPATAINARPNEPVDRALCARLIASRSARLLRLLELQAPELVIEDERRLIARALAKFPIDAQCARLSDSFDAENEKAAPGGML